jgi:hypothetical protein
LRGTMTAAMSRRRRCGRRLLSGVSWLRGLTGRAERGDHHRDWQPQQPIRRTHSSLLLFEMRSRPRFHPEDLFDQTDDCKVTIVRRRPGGNV